MDSTRHSHLDRAHHHPAVRNVRGRWTWVCACGGASCRTTQLQPNWRRAMVEALFHATQLAA
jgi:hypothetical protein